jgi:hypothetical protein
MRCFRHISLRDDAFVFVARINHDPCIGRLMLRSMCCLAGADILLSRLVTVYLYVPCFLSFTSTLLSNTHTWFFSQDLTLPANNTMVGYDPAMNWNAFTITLGQDDDVVFMITIPTDASDTDVMRLRMCA